MGKGFVQWLKVRHTRFHCSLALTMVEPHQVVIMYCIIIGLFFLVAYGIYIFFPPHVRHLAYLAGIIDKPLVTAHEL